MLLVAMVTGVKLGSGELLRSWLLWRRTFLLKVDTTCPDGQNLSGEWTPELMETPTINTKV